LTVFYCPKAFDGEGFYWIGKGKDNTTRFMKQALRPKKKLLSAPIWSKRSLQTSPETYGGENMDSIKSKAENQHENRESIFSKAMRFWIEISSYGFGFGVHPYWWNFGCGRLTGTFMVYQDSRSR